MDEISELIETVTEMPERRRRLIQRVAIRRMQRRGMITEAQVTELEAMDWQSFLDWLLENGPAIIEFIMQIIALFSL